jgi:thiamine-monophosphate kinase
MSGAEDEAFDEFAFIAEVLRPLTYGAPEALDLKDDAALLPGPDGSEFVVTTDVLVEGVHFLASDPPDLVARKLLRVNLSDLAAKGADPYGYLLVTCWPHDYSVEARRRFVRGLAEDQQAYGLTLFGGDISSTPGPLTVSATVFGRAPDRRAVLRSGAVVGDRLLVTGTIGDGWLGLQAVTGGLADMDREHLDFLADRYRLPQPRLGIARPLRDHARAGVDVSDGLVADVGHIIEASGQGVRIDLERLPLSPAAQEWVDRQLGRDDALAALATGGDDYEIAIAAPPRAVEELSAAAERAGIRLTDIGEFTAGPGVLVASHGAPVEVARAGWKHG